KMLQITNLLAVCLLIPVIFSSPFELTEKYVKDFQDGIDRLVEVSDKTILQEESYKPENYDEEAALKDAEEFDFIVIGAGSSGAVVANRLSEVPEWKVLVLEAGAPESLYAQPPSMRNILLNTPYNWGYKSEPQEKACQGANDDRCNINTGRALGGSSAISKMIYTRGSGKDYDTWADLGNDGWCYKDVLPYFKKSEDAHLHKFDRKYHSQGGPLNVEEPQHNSKLREAFLQAGQELGYKVIEANGEEPIGVATPQLVTKGGRRSSVSRAYLETAKSRKNLSVRPFSQVTQILIAPHTKEANGVKYVHKGKLFIAKSKKEIIVSAGAINSPQLLMLSGIGPKEHLESLGLECIQDLAVGNNLKDHVVFLGMNLVSNETISEGDQKENLISWLKDGKGPLSQTGVEALAFLKTDASKDAKHPDIKFIVVPHAMNLGYDYAKREYNIRKELYDSIWAANEGKLGCSIFVVLPHPKSTGTVRLHTKDPLNYPIINGNYLTDEEQV
ncbi:FAD dependent oxidoreductase, partial [Oryctes borbonicus]